ncbi:MAG TPA: hypothetical protein VKN99_15725 [Polyangia bacterium]|nr:hypothetical protein [Polyangia bacterium]
METTTRPHGRRLRDRLVAREGTANPTLLRYELQNLLLFVDDDLRETALALGGIESFLTHALAVLEKEDVVPDELAALACDANVLDRLDYLGETLSNLRRRMGLIAQTLK